MTQCEIFFMLIGAAMGATLVNFIWLMLSRLDK